MAKETTEQLRERILCHGRVWNTWADKAAQADPHLGCWTREEIANLLDSPRYADIQWRFFRNEHISVYQDIVKDIPLTTIFSFARNIMRPIYTDFTETSENKDFARIAGKFYFHLFIQEEIYVSYDLFAGDIDLEIKANDPSNQPVIDEMKRQKFDLWIKVSGTEYDNDNDFINIATSQVVEIHNWREHLARVRWGADFLDNFTNWINIAITQLTLEEFVKQAAKLVGTRVQISTDVNSTAQRKKLAAMLESMNNTIYQQFDDKIDVTPIEFMTGQDLKELRDTIYYYLDRIKYEYGRVTNTNPKGDKYSVLESYKDITGIANRQKETLEELIYFAYQAEDKWNVHLEFSVAGIPEKEAIYTVSHLAQNPNSEKEYFGQVEGTVPRRPIGQPGRRMSNNRSKQNK